MKKKEKRVCNTRWLQCQELIVYLMTFRATSSSSDVKATVEIDAIFKRYVINTPDVRAIVPFLLPAQSPTSRTGTTSLVLLCHVVNEGLFDSMCQFKKITATRLADKMTRNNDCCRLWRPLN